MGTDNLKEIETWHQPERLLTEYKIIALERDNDKLEGIIANNNILNNNRKSLIKIDGIDKIYLSSSIVRDKIKNGEDVKEYIPKKVLEYIRSNKLYK